MSRSQRLLLLTLSLCCIVSSFAQDPVHRHGFSANRPWKKFAPASSQRRRQGPSRLHHQRQPYFGEDYSTHFLDYEDAKRDNRSRLWSVNLKSRRPGKLSWTSRLIWATVGCFGLQMFRPAVTQWGIKLSDRILAGQELYRLVTPIFLHGNIFHLVTNMVSLSRVGHDVEPLFGPGRFLATYLAAGVAGNVFSVFKSPNPSLGASGAVFGIVGAYFVFASRHDWLLGSYSEAVTSSIMQTVAANIFLGMMNPVIDNWAHLGGALGGAAVAYYFGPKLYLADLPDGGRTIVDRPVLRLPRPIESIPERVGDLSKRITRRMQVERYKFDMPDKPWRPRQRRSNFPRRSTPNRSIKPKDVD